MSTETTYLSSARVEWGETWPALPEFRRMAADRRVIPVVRRLLADDVTPVGLYRQLAGGRPGTFILESAEHDGAWARWSFVGAASRATLTSRDGHATWHGDVPVGIPAAGPVLEVLGAALAELATPAIPGLPPLTGGLVGSLGWEVLRQWEPTLRAQAPVEHDTPDVALCLATDMAAVDHHDGSVWLIANAVNFDNTDERVDAAHADAVARLDAMEAALLRPATTAAAVTVPAEQPELRFRTPREDFETAVLAAKQAIYDGEVFQVVLSQRLDIDCAADPLDVYRVLRTINPSPYMYYLQLADPDGPAGDGGAGDGPAGGAGAGGTFAVVGSSPETLVHVQDGTVTTFPIAGSRPRGATQAEDRALAEELLADPKEIAEHVMLVDLARNDLTKVCRPETVDVVELMEIKRFSHIMHISSTVQGRQRDGTSALDCLTATFPAGTLSGAPKPRAIELIDALEPARRGVYGGVVGYFDFAGNLDMAIAIRTAVIRGRQASVQAGAGIVADSVPATEYEETRNKAAAAVRAIQVAAGLRPLADRAGARP
ncbi:anthranilate synthase component I [Georgenia thermotolerans]|uniref:Anthranilate synthase component 1 n=1 Tax=Georgenia thermotolerans TaxID=527326 RepID=A0A7J5USY2_9MICO|nr:anthranilate synthase component I [Georgenia thermotolerans]KAE8765448.1 anthranilate synthase component I [Georgenia thermotolerans]